MKKRKNLTVWLAMSMFLLLMVSTATGEIIFVDVDATGNNDGMSWADAFKFLQDALTVAQYSDEIRVAQGIYKPDHGGGNTPGSRTATFRLNNGVTIKGGYAGFGEPDPDARDIDLYEAILSGDLAGNDTGVKDPRYLLSHPSRAENSFHVVTGSDTDSTAVLDGFTINGGIANYGPDRYYSNPNNVILTPPPLYSSNNNWGGGMFNLEGSPTVTNCTLEGNSAYRGGGMYNKYSNPNLTNCTFSCNSAAQGWAGGGMYNISSNPTLTNCTFSRNSVAAPGGGMYNASGSPRLTNCTFNANTSDYGGAGMYNSGGSPEFANCTFSGNTSLWGGGIYCSGGVTTFTNCTFSSNSATGFLAYGGGLLNASSATLINCTFSGNWASYGGGGMCNSGGSATLSNCIFNTNSTHYAGGGMYNRRSTNLRLTNCTFTSNSALHGNALACNSREQKYPSNVQVSNCILRDDGNEIWNNDNSVIAITYSNVQGGWFGLGGNNIDADPGFALNDDCHISAGSPCIDSGTNGPPGGLSSTDLDGNPRLLDGDGDGMAMADIGAYEYNPAAPTIVLYPVALTFSVREGGPNPEGKTLFVSNSGGATLNWELAEDCPWLSVSHTTGQLAPGAIDEVKMTVDASGLFHGGYACVMTVSDPQAVNSPQTCTLTLNICTTLYIPEEFDTIQKAIKAAVDGDIILVADGVYKGAGNKNLDFNGKAIALRSKHGPTNCIIDCEGDGRGFYFHSGESKEAKVDGFTICNGWVYHGGGGIYCHHSNPSITNCIIRKNFASYEGGGISSEDSKPTISNCTVSGNLTRFGGGISCGPYSRATISNCTFVGNSAGESGGGIYNIYAGSTITNCISWSNMDSGGMDESAQIYDFAALNYCCIQGLTGALGGTGNIDSDPLFVEPGYWDANGMWVEGDYHLLYDSPCIDAGDPSYVAEPNETDLDGRPRVIGGRIDMGAYEFNHIPIADAGPDQTIHAWIDGIAEVTLDGTGSYDDDGQPLTCLWSWTIDGQTYDVNGVTPVIELPVGEQTIELIVNDGIDDSEPDEVVITVIEPVESQLRIAPRVINRHSHQPGILALVRLPQGVTADQIDSNEQLLLYPDGIEAIRQRVTESRSRGVSIFALFDKAELMDAVSANGSVELQVVGQLKTGQYFYGSDTVLVIGNW